MKKIYALFVMMCVVLGASANPIYCVDKKVEFSPIEKDSKHYSHEAIRQALAVPSEVAKAAESAEHVDTVSIVATDLYIDEFAFLGMVFVTVEASNEEYSITLVANNYLTPGEYGTETFSLQSSVIQDKVNMVEILLTDVDLTVTGEGNARTIVGSVVGENNVLYNLDLSFVAPETTDTVEIVFDTPAEAVWYSGSGDYYIHNENEEYVIYLDIIAEQDKLVGEFTADDFLLNYTAVCEIVDGEKIAAYALDAKAVATEIGERLVHIEAEVLGRNFKRYMISTDVKLSKPHLPLDESSGSVEKTFSEEAQMAWRENSGFIALDVDDGVNYLALLFVTQEDEETIIPVGTYTIDNSEETGTVVASSGVNEQGQVSYSFYATVSPQGGLATPVYFFVSGTVEVTVEGDKLKLEVNALNSYDVPVHVVCEYPLATETAVEDTMVEQGNTRKVVQDGQLYIIKEGVKYGVLGVKL